MVSLVMQTLSALFAVVFVYVTATPIVYDRDTPIIFDSPTIYDGRAPLSLTNADLDTSASPYLTVVKGTEDATHYSTLLGKTPPPTPLWNTPVQIEQVVSVSIDNTSIFTPGSGPPQNGFRRTELLAQLGGSHTATVPLMEVDTTVFHFSIMRDPSRPLNFSHEYQVVFIEPNDGSHIFGIQLGSPFTIPTGTLPAPDAHSLKVLDHSLNVLFSAPFSPSTWHNLAIQVDWTKLTLAAFYSTNDTTLQAATPVVPNPAAMAGAAGQGDFHFGVLKLPVVDRADAEANQGDVAHHGIQEGSTEGLLYSGVFVESVVNGVSVGGGRHVPRL